MIVTVAIGIAGSARSTWTLCGLAWLIGLRHAVVNAFIQELRPFYLPCVGVEFFLRPVLEGHVLTFGSYLRLGLAVANWFFYRNSGDDDDDRWKRRRRKVSEKVANIGGRLEVVPAGAR